MRRTSGKSSIPLSGYDSSSPGLCRPSFGVLGALCFQTMGYINHIAFKIISLAWQPLMLSSCLASFTQATLLCFSGLLVQLSAGEGIEGQVFQRAVFGLLATRMVCLIAMSNMKTKVAGMAVDEHMSRICKRRRKGKVCISEGSSLP